MAKREALLAYLWNDVINLNLREASLDNVIAHCKRNPAGPFGDTGPAIERMLAAGASKRDLCLVLRATAYDAVFGTLCVLGSSADALDLQFSNLLACCVNLGVQEGHLVAQLPDDRFK